MNDAATATALLRAATELFAEKGFDGASIRAITARAGANLGAVTYHFGSKERLYAAVIERAVTPFRQRLIAAAATGDGAPLDRIEAVVRAFFDHMHEHPHLRRIMLQLLSSHRPIPEPAKRAIGGNIETIGGLIVLGQRDGSIRAGDPRAMALSVGAQPAVLNFIAPALRQGAGMDLADPAVFKHLVENAVRFVRAGLQQAREDG